MMEALKQSKLNPVLRIQRMQSVSFDHLDPTLLPDDRNINIIENMIL